MHLIIDGYNVIKSGQNNSSAKENLSLLRDNLIRKLSAYKGSKIHNITVVFDGFYSENQSRNTEHINGVKVIYSKQNERADDIIKEIVSNVSNPNDVLVVTSDNGLKNAVRVEGVSITSSDSLGKRLSYFKEYKKKTLSKAEYFEKNVKGYVEEEDKTGRKGNSQKQKKIKKWSKNLW